MGHSNQGWVIFSFHKFMAQVDLNLVNPEIRLQEVAYIFLKSSKVWGSIADQGKYGRDRQNPPGTAPQHPWLVRLPFCRIKLWVLPPIAPTSDPAAPVDLRTFLADHNTP